MKQNERIIRTGDYYELETIEDLMMQQKIVKKQEPQSSTNIPPPPTNILTTLPSRKQALNAYFVPASASIRTQDFGLNQYQSSLQALLAQPIKDEQRLEIEKLLKQIQQIKEDSQLPLNNLPQPVIYKKPEQAKNIPKQVNLQTNIKIDDLQKQVNQLEGLKFMQLSRLQHLIDILLGQIKLQTTNPQPTQIDQKAKTDIQSIYNNLNSLTCLKGLPSILNKIASNEIKFQQMSQWVSKTEQINDLNKQIKDQFENDQIILKQLEQSFKQNTAKVRQAIKKLSE